MKFYTGILFVFLLFYNREWPAQNKSEYRNNSISIEAFGSGTYSSLNYEYLLNQLADKKFRIGFNAGFSTYKLRDIYNRFNPDLVFPTSIRTYFGLHHNLVLGVGKTFTSVNKIDSDYGMRLVRENTHTINAVFGYRYDYAMFTYQLLYLPTFKDGACLQNLAAISIGLKF